MNAIVFDLIMHHFPRNIKHPFFLNLFIFQFVALVVSELAQYSKPMHMSTKNN
jgi:hypothetical protein